MLIPKHQHMHTKGTPTLGTQTSVKGELKKKIYRNPFWDEPQITTTQIQHQTLSHQHILTPKHQHVHTKGTPTPGTQTSVKGELKTKSRPQPLLGGAPKSQQPKLNTKNFHTNTC